MTPIYFQHLLLLVGSLHHLLSKEISTSSLDATENNLNTFVQIFAKLYGKLPFGPSAL